jgi:hypothetical protein
MLELRLNRVHSGLRHFMFFLTNTNANIFCKCLGMMISLLYNTSLACNWISEFHDDALAWIPKWAGMTHFGGLRIWRLFGDCFLIHKVELTTQAEVVFYLTKLYDMETGYNPGADPAQDLSGGLLLVGPLQLQEKGPVCTENPKLEWRPVPPLGPAWVCPWYNPFAANSLLVTIVYLWFKDLEDPD